MTIVAAAIVVLAVVVAVVVLVIVIVVVVVVYEDNTRRTSLSLVTTNISKQSLLYHGANHSGSHTSLERRTNYN